MLLHDVVHLRLLYIIADLVTHPLPLTVQIIAMFLCHNTVIHSGVLSICNIIYKCLEEKVGQQYYQYQPLISNNRTHTHARTHLCDYEPLVQSFPCSQHPDITEILHDRKHKLWNIISTERYLHHM
jgi:hypothetical protein